MFSVILFKCGIIVRDCISQRSFSIVFVAPIADMVSLMSFTYPIDGCFFFQVVEVIISPQGFKSGMAGFYGALHPLTDRLFRQSFAPNAYFINQSAESIIYIVNSDSTGKDGNCRIGFGHLFSIKIKYGLLSVTSQCHMVPLVIQCFRCRKIGTGRVKFAFFYDQRQIVHPVQFTVFTSSDDNFKTVPFTVVTFNPGLQGPRRFQNSHTCSYVIVFPVEAEGEIRLPAF